MQTLRHLAAQVRHRMQVYETWGFSATGRRGLGVSALFAGDSGTGKTMAAEVLAHELGLDLYRIDLSAVVSKYIGETEKNLRQVFDAAEEGGSILLFDEADALFAKRGEVKDSHDRYANVEVGYLLQRMESYQGLAILTTNLRSSLDRAFTRRLRFTIHFPFPDAEQRERIWTPGLPGRSPHQGNRVRQAGAAQGDGRQHQEHRDERGVPRCRGRRADRHGSPARGGAPGGGQARAADLRRRDEGMGMSRIRVTIDQLVLNGIRRRVTGRPSSTGCRPSSRWPSPTRGPEPNGPGPPARTCCGWAASPRSAEPAGRRSFGRRLGRAIERSLKR